MNNKLFVKKVLNRFFVQKNFLNNKYVFIHIPKTGGISVCKALNIEPHGHKTYKEYEYILNSDQYFFFTFIREPVDRFLSAYNFLIQGGRNKKDTRNKNKFDIRKNNFREFLNNLDKLNNLPIHFISQSYFLLNKKNKIEIDFIGDYKNLKNEFEYLCNLLKINANVLKTENKSVKYITKLDLTDSDIKKILNFYKEDHDIYNSIINK